jgi:hypothetical protein
VITGVTSPLHSKSPITEGEQTARTLRVRLLARISAEERIAPSDRLSLLKFSALVE